MARITFDAKVFAVAGRGETKTMDDSRARAFVEAGQAHYEGEAPQKKDLSKYTVAELKAHAETEGIDLGDAVLKADILAAIGTAEA